MVSPPRRIGLSRVFWRGGGWGVNILALDGPTYQIQVSYVAWNPLKSLMLVGCRWWLVSGGGGQKVKEFCNGPNLVFGA